MLFAAAYLRGHAFDDTHGSIMRAIANAAAYAAIPLLLLMSVSPSAAQRVSPVFENQWGLVAIKAEYPLLQGYTGAGVGVVVVDGLFQLDHPQFAGRVGDYIYNPQGVLPDRHGTAAAGLVGAAGYSDGGRGMQGVAPGATLNSIALFDNANPSQRVLNNDQLAQGYNGALDRGMRIFNNSWGFSNDATGRIDNFDAADARNRLGNVLTALERSVALGSVQVWATANGHQNQPDLYAGLPYLFPHLQPGWIAVTAVDRDLTTSSFANDCGVAASWCIAAPGRDIYTTVPNSTYSNGWWGTSFAAPQVTGAVAIAKEMFPHKSGPELARLILITATDIGPRGLDPIYGWGLLNLQNLSEVMGASGSPGDDEDGSDNGAVFVNAAYARFAAVDTLVSTMWDRSANHILQESGGAAPKLSVAQAMAPAPVSAMALGGPIRDDASDTAVTISTGRSAAVWAQGLAAHASLQGTPRSTADLGGAIGGYDLFDNGTLSGGLAIAYTNSNLDTHGTGDDSSATGWHGYAYATWQENSWFVDGIIGGNWFDNTYKRTTIGGTEGTVLGEQGIAGYSSNDTSGVSGRLAGGHVYAFRDGALMPYAYVNLIHQKTGGSAEQGADIFSLEVNATSLDQVEGGIGTRAQLYGLAYYGFTIAPAVDLAYGRLGGDASLPVGFDLLGNELAANAGYLGRNVFRVGTQLDVMRFDQMVGGFVAYDGRFQENAQNNTFSGGLIVRF
jgi:subtilase-type serine protease